VSVEVKPGRWRMRCGKTAIVEDREGKGVHPRCVPWRGRDANGRRHTWGDDGLWFDDTRQTPFDLVEYLGPEEQTGGAS
jgi:hypothetical protein